LAQNPNPQRTFREVTDPKKWVRDYEYQLAERGIGLDELVAERKEKLKRMVDADLLKVEIPAVPNADADAESINGEQTEQ